MAFLGFIGFLGFLGFNGFLCFSGFFSRLIGFLGFIRLTGNGTKRGRLTLKPEGNGLIQFCMNFCPPTSHLFAVQIGRAGRRAIPIYKENKAAISKP